MERRGIAATARALAAAAAFAAPAAHAAPALPNVLLVVIDTLRADHSSADGYARDTTPSLRALAAGGARFSSAYAPAPSTGPSHASLFTGTYPATHRVLQNGLPLDAATPTLAEILRARGYRTAAFVSSFAVAGKFGFARGFDVYDDHFDAGTASVEVKRWEGHAVGGAFDRRADATTRRAIRWLWEERESPFLLFVHYFDPHTPYAPPAAFADAFALDDPPGAAAAGEPEYRIEVRNYDREIAFADREIGRLLGALDGVGLSDQTLVVVTADHGEGLLDHGIWTHGLDVYEESVRVPLLLRWPGHIPARRFDTPVELVDVAPTLLDLLGLPAPEAPLEGRSLAPALRGEAPLDPERAVYLYRRPYGGESTLGIRIEREQHAVRRGRFKYIETSEVGRSELYDLGADPRERSDLREREPARAAELAALLEQRRSRYEKGAPVPEVREHDRRALEALGYADPPPR